jgi:hypothetical protein
MHGDMNVKYTATSHKGQENPGESTALTVITGSQESPRVCADAADGR